MINAVGVDKGKAGTVDEAQAGKVEFSEQCSCIIFDLFGDSQYTKILTEDRRRTDICRGLWRDRCLCNLLQYR